MRRKEVGCGWVGGVVNGWLGSTSEVKTGGDERTMRNSELAAVDN